MTDELEFKWVFNPPQKATKQPDIISPKDFDSLVDRINNEGVDPLVAARNQALLWMTYYVQELIFVFMNTERSQ
ncbi:MAG: hypothetical protein RPT12_17000 [Vibrio anguillarum]|nr:hypothetical protein [Vibrio anguillarum]